MMIASPPPTGIIRPPCQRLLCGVAFLVLAVTTSARAENNGACASLAEQVQSATRAVQKSASDRAVTLATPEGLELRIVCPAFAKSPSGFSIVATWNDGSLPADGFFQQVASAGAVLTGETGTKLQKALRTCQADASQSQTSTAEIEAGKAYLNCQSFVRLGGATTITIYHSIPAKTAP